MQPAHPTQPTQPMQPAHPTQPTHPSVPAMPTLAAIPADQVTATLPATPALPDTATLPATPAEPATATLPATPAEPATATFPATPAQPAFELFIARTIVLAPRLVRLAVGASLGASPMYRSPVGIDTSHVASPASTTPQDFSLPSLDVRLVARRAALPLALAAAAVAVVLAAGGPIQLFADALSRAVDADPRWIAVGVVAELLSFGGYIMLFWLVGRRATPRLDLRAGAEITLGGAAATRLLPTAGVGGAALTLWAILKTGVGTKRAGRTLLTFLSLLYGAFLAGIAISGFAIVLGAGDATGHTLLAAVAAAAASTAIAIALVLAFRRGEGEGEGRIGRGAAMLGGSIREALGFVRGGDARLLGAPAWWVFDAAVLWATFHALGQPPALAVLAFAYFAGQVGNTIPIPGAVSGGMVGTLLAFGVAPDLALTSVLAYRAIAIWLPAPIGLVGLTALRARIARWGREDEDAAELAGAITAPALVAPALVAPGLAAPARPIVRPALATPCACSGST
jgi:putative heme transporter